MQDKNKKKTLIKNALASVVKELRGNKSQFIFSSENDIPISVVSLVEQAQKDPQLTTMFKLAEAFNMPLSKLIELIQEKLPDGFSLIEN